MQQSVLWPIQPKFCVSDGQLGPAYRAHQASAADYIADTRSLSSKNYDTVGVKRMWTIWK